MVAGLHALWNRHGVPGRVQFDNGGPFTLAHGVGEVVRFCLHQGAVPVFIPPREPWRNGTIERFNDTFDKRFFRQERFTDRAQLAERAGAFEAFHNSQHRYRATNGRAPDETARPRRGRAGRWPSTSSPSGWPAAGRDRVHPLHPLRPQAAAAGARRSRCPTATPTSTSPPPWTWPSPRGSDNLLVCDEHGELIATSRLAGPRR